MKTFILSCFPRLRRLAVLIALIAICLFTPAEALRAQTVTWTSSHPDIVSVDANGTIKMISEPTEANDIVITATTVKNGLTVTSTKIVAVDNLCSENTQDGQCCKFNGLQYCVITQNGVTILDRNIGATSAAVRGNTYNVRVAKENICPAGFHLPRTSAEAYAILPTWAYANANASIFAPIGNCSSLCRGVLAEQNCAWYHYANGNTANSMPYINCSEDDMPPARCIKN